MGDEEKFMVNSVLCYICSARNSLDKEIIISSVFNFYEQKEILEAKNLICNFTKTDPRRRTGEGKTIRDITDILDILNEINENNIKIPLFVTKKWNSLPPPNSEFGPLSRNVTHLSEIIYTLGNELEKINEKTEKAKDYEEHLLDIKEDIADIKKAQIIQQQESRSFKQDVAKTSKISSSAGPEKSIFLNHEPSFSNPSERSNYLYSLAASAPPLPHLNLTNLKKRKKTFTSPDIVAVQLPDDEAKITFPPKNNDDGWTLVDSQKRRKNLKNNSIIGSGKFNDNNEFSSAPRSLDLFIGGCSLHTRPEDISSFCEKQHKIKVTVIDMNSKSEFRKSFKVTVDSSNRDKLLDTTKWPQGVIVRKFTVRRNQNTFGATNY